MQIGRLSKSIALTITSEIFNKIYPLIVIKLVIERLGYEGFGFAQFGISIIEVAEIFIIFGYHNYATIVIGQNNQNAENIQDVLSSTLLLKMIHTLILCLGIFIFLILNTEYVHYLPLFYALFYSTIGTTLDASWLTISMQKMQFRSLLIVSSKVVSLFGIIFLVRSHNDVLVYAVLHCLANFIVNIYTYYYFSKKYPIKLPSSWSTVSRIFKKSLPFAAFAILNIILMRLDWFLVKFSFTDLSLGHYAGPARISNAIYNFLTAVGLVFFSESILSKNKDQLSQNYHYTTFIFSFLLFPIIAISIFFDREILNLLLGDVVLSQIGLFPILIFSNIGSLAYSIFGLQILAANGQASKVVTSMIFGICFSIGLFLYFYNLKNEYLNISNIAIIILLGKIIIAAIQAVYSSRYLHKILYKSVVKNLMATLVSCFIMKILMQDLININFIFQIICFGFIYLAATLILNYNTIYNLYKKLRKTS